MFSLENRVNHFQLTRTSNQGVKEDIAYSWAPKSRWLYDYFKHIAKILVLTFICNIYGLPKLFQRTLYIMGPWDLHSFKLICHTSVYCYYFILSTLRAKMNV